MANPIDDIDNILMKLRGAQVEPTDLTSWNNTRTAIKNLLLEARKQEREIALTYLHDTNRKQDYLNKLARLAALQKELG